MVLETSSLSEEEEDPLTGCQAVLARTITRCCLNRFQKFVKGIETFIVVQGEIPKTRNFQLLSAEQFSLGNCENIISTDGESLCEVSVSFLPIVRYSDTENEEEGPVGLYKKLELFPYDSGDSR